MRPGPLMDVQRTAGGQHLLGAAALAIANANVDPWLLQVRRLGHIYPNSGCTSITGKARPARLHIC